MPSTNARKFARAGAKFVLGVALALPALLAVSPASAQQPAKPDSNTAMATNQSTLDQKPSLMPKGMIMGPQAINEDALGRLCDPRTAGFTGWRIAQFERHLSFTDEQKTKLEDFKAASAKALDDLVRSCPKQVPLTPAGRLEMMEQHYAALLDATKALRTAFDPFYASLTDEQKARLTADQRGRGWRWQTVRERQ
jgi:hypothetical protein